MSDTTPQIEFVDDPIEITTETTLSQAEYGLGMSLRIGRKMDRFVFRFREQFAPETSSAAAGTH